MNIEIANRLVNLRKSNNLSQEALAEKLGISRQAVSKWERAEASPDTDNLILLARLYGVSLDQLLQTEDEIPRQEITMSQGTEQGDSEAGGKEQKTDPEVPEYAHVGLNGIHVKDKDSEVHVGWSGIHVEDNRGKGDTVHIDKNGIFVNNEKYDMDWFTHHGHFPMFLTVLVVYALIGCVWGAWHPGWLLFLLVPLWHTFVEAVKKRNAMIFAYPILATLAFLCFGFFCGLWHPGWVVFLTIPLYYSLVAYFTESIKRRKSKKENQENVEEAGGSYEEE